MEGPSRTDWTWRRAKQIIDHRPAAWNALVRESRTPQWAVWIIVALGFSAFGASWLVKKGQVGAWLPLAAIAACFSWALITSRLCKRRTNRFHQFLDANRCFKCGTARREFLEQCSECGLNAADELDFRFAMRHLRAPRSRVIDQAERRLGRIQMIVAVVSLGVLFAGVAFVSRKELDTFTGNSAITAVLALLWIFACLLVPAFLVFLRHKRRMRQKLASLADRCINCENEIDGRSDDDFCGHCGASLLYRRTLLMTGSSSDFGPPILSPVYFVTPDGAELANVDQMLRTLDADIELAEGQPANDASGEMREYLRLTRDGQEAFVGIGDSNRDAKRITYVVAHDGKNCSSLLLDITATIENAGWKRAY